MKTLNDILDNETASTQRTKQSQGKSVSDAKGGNGKDCVDIDEKVALEDKPKSPTKVWRKRME